MQDVYLLQEIHQSAELGKAAAENALYHSADPLFRNALHRQCRHYQEIYSTAANYLIARGIPPKSASPLRRLGCAAAAARHRSSSGMAAEMIRRQASELQKSTQQIRGYKGNDLLVLSLANELKKTEERSINEMKNFAQARKETQSD